METVNLMREEYKNKKATYNQLASKYNISYGHVGQIIRNEIWCDTQGLRNAPRADSDDDGEPD